MGRLLEGKFGKPSVPPTQPSPVHRGPWRAQRNEDLTDTFTAKTRQLLSIEPNIISSTEWTDAVTQLYQSTRESAMPGAYVARLLYEACYTPDRISRTLDGLFETYKGEQGYLYTALEALSRGSPSHERAGAIARINAELDALSLRGS